ncbi:MAG: hypothetical protein AB8B99_07500 [Phormidesmis sp.]
MATDTLSNIFVGIFRAGMFGAYVASYLFITAYRVSGEVDEQPIANCLTQIA